MVEFDIHVGLLDSLEIVWREHHITQTLDYLGIPLRCSLIQKIGHLRWECEGLFEEEV